MPRPAPTRRDRAREEDVARVTEPLPGRSLVTKRAIRDLVRTAVLSAYGVTGFAGGGPVGRVLGRLGLAHPGLARRGGRRAHGGPAPHRRLRAAHRRGGAPGGVVGALHAAPRPRPRARPRVDPDRPHGPPARHPARRRAAPGGRRARRTSQPAGRTSPDAPSILRRRRLPVGAPQRGRPPRGQRRRGQRPQRLPGPGRRHRHQHAGHGQGGARGGGQGGPGRPTPSASPRPRRSGR